ncbi:hypothetical protein L6452_02648 [Arctium lappa]|uniref:Uncharacterized protein n=1 Tax=Arctium lappa TaxID=4217 RepID=A0ACB9FL13_ARCLA|nr:hypothetical protein L6452_02648 [Arctium lappa]
MSNESTSTSSTLSFVTGQGSPSSSDATSAEATEGILATITETVVADLSNATYTGQSFPSLETVQQIANLTPEIPLAGLEPRCIKERRSSPYPDFRYPELHYPDFRYPEPPYPDCYLSGTAIHRPTPVSSKPGPNLPQLYLVFGTTDCFPDSSIPGSINSWVSDNEAQDQDDNDQFLLKNEHIAES